MEKNRLIRNDRRNMLAPVAWFLLAFAPIFSNGRQREKHVPPDFEKKMQAIRNLESGVAPLFVIGDLNEDGIVNEKDFQLAQAFVERKSPAGISCLAAGDLNTDGVVDARDVALFQETLKRGPVTAPPLAYHSGLPCDYKNFFVAATSGARAGGAVPVHFLDPRFNAQNSSLSVQSGPATVAKNGNAYRVQVSKSAPPNSVVTLAITLADNRKYVYTFLVH